MPGARPLRGAYRNEVAVGLYMAIADERLHRRDKRDV